MQAGQFRVGEGASVAAGADSGAEEALVGVDIADSVQQLLIQECGFDGSFAAIKKRAKFLQRDIERLFACALEASCGLFP